ncbi:MAG: hypothetical protein ACOVOJ_15050 [Pirellula sp.]
MRFYDQSPPGVSFRSNISSVKPLSIITGNPKHGNLKVISKELRNIYETLRKTQVIRILTRGFDKNVQDVY